MKIKSAEPFGEHSSITLYEDGTRKLFLNNCIAVAQLTNDGLLTIESVVLIHPWAYDCIKPFIKKYIPHEMDMEVIEYLAILHIALNINTGEVIDLQKGSFENDYLPRPNELLDLLERRVRFRI